MSLITKLYIEIVQQKLGHFPSSKELKKEMLKDETIETTASISLGISTVRFSVNIGNNKHIQEEHSFKDIEDFREKMALIIGVE